MTQRKNNLKAARMKFGKTQMQVAIETGMHIRAYQSYEHGTGQNTIQTAIRIARALGTTVEKLWGDSPAA